MPIKKIGIILEYLLNYYAERDGKEKIGEISGRVELGYIRWFISTDFKYYFLLVT